MTTQHPITSTRLGLGLASLVLAGLLLVGFKGPDGAAAVNASTGGSGSGTGSSSGSSGGTSGTTGTTGSGGSSTGSTGSTGSGSTGSGSTAKAGTYDGSAIDIGYGVVQVEITVSGGKVTKVTELSLPTGGRSGRIADYAAPILEQEALSAQSAQIDVVSGATYTSEGFAQSLQAALSEAGL